MKLTKTLLISAVLLMSASGLQAAGFIQKGNYLTVQLKQHQNFGPSQIRLQVVSDKIIRVQATAEQGFRDKQSLIIVPQKGKANYKVEEQGEQLIITTAAMRAVLNEATGQITFYDLKDHVLLNEVAQGGKTFKPFTVPDREIGVDIAKVPESQKHGWSWRALFDSPDNEAFYGLGQHQSEELNMKGKNEDLFQYNTKVSVPFVISNKNYGILWDSYSYCRWGNPEDYLQLNRAFKLYDKDGKEGQLTGTYVDKNGQKIVRGEDSIYFEYAMPETSEICNKTDKGGIQNLPKGFALNGSKVVYEGYVEAPTNSFYQFILYYAGYMKIYIDGKLVVPERWRTAWNPNSFKFETPIRKGVKTPIRIEWQPDGDVSYCGLRVAAPRSEAEKNQLSIWSEMSPDMDYYFIAGQNLDEVISGYRTLTGKASLYPKWTLGFWQSRERYKSSKDIEENLKKFRDLKIPVDNIVQDWNYWKLDSWGSHEFEAARYPNPQAMLDSVHAMNGRFMISVWPKFYDTVKNYKELDSRGWMYHQAIKDDIHDWLGFRGSFYDAYDAGDILVIPPNLVHAIHQKDSEIMEYFNILFKFQLLEPDENSTTYQKYFAKFLQNNFFTVHLRYGTELNSKIRSEIEYLIDNRHEKYETQELKDMEEIARLLSSPAFYDENTHQLNFAAFNLLCRLYYLVFCLIKIHKIQRFERLSFFDMHLTVIFRHITAG